MGAVIGGDQLGGLIGTNVGSLSCVYSTGLVRAAVGATPTEIGGLIGEDDSGGGQIQLAYWDTLTSGQPTVGVGAFGTPGEVNGFSTEDLQSTATVGVTLGAAFAGGAAGGENGVYPYLVDFFPNGVQAVSGFVYSDAAVTPLVAATVGVIANGVSLGTASTGFNGYYYILTAAGGVPTGHSVLAYGNNPAAATLATSSGANNTSGVNLYGDALSGTSSDTYFSQVVTDFIPRLAAATGGNSQAASAILNANGLYLIATGASFTLDEAFTASAADSMLVIKTTAATAPITVANAIAIDGTNTLELDASGSLSIDAAISIAGAGVVNLSYGAGGLSFDPGPTGFGGSLSYAVGGGEGITGQALTINGMSYDLLYSMADVSSIDGSVKAFALAAPITATGTLTSAVVGTFPGILDGLGNSITGLNISSAGSNVGLIGRLNRAGVVSNIGLNGGTVSGDDVVGGLVALNTGTITDVFTSGAVSAANGVDVGGLVGFNAVSGAITGAFAGGATVSAGGGAGVGGLVGTNAGAVDNSSSSDTVDNAATGRQTGGLVGYNGAGAVISNGSASGTVTGGTGNTGGLVGYNGASATISGGTATGTVNGVDVVGGLVGENLGTISSGQASGNVSAPNGLDVGGLVGFKANSATITGASATGVSVSASGASGVGGLVGANAGSVGNSTSSETVDNGAAGRHTGGLVGYNGAGASISNSSASGTVDGGASNTGGLVGYNGANAMLSGDSASGPVNGVDEVGGLVGDNRGTISNDQAGGNVSAPNGLDVGGLAGFSASGGSITSSFASGDDVSAAGATGVGGLVGTSAGNISDTYADFTSITGKTDVGGLVGYNGGGIATSWSSGAVSGTSVVGGSIGRQIGGTLTNVYWDEGTSGWTTGTGFGSSAGLTGIGGATGKNPDVQATYNFNFSTVWTINAGTSRPYLQNVTPATPPN